MHIIKNHPLLITNKNFYRYIYPPFCGRFTTHTELTENLYESSQSLHLCECVLVGKKE